MARRQNAWLTPDNGDTTVVGGCLYVPRVLVPMVTGALSALTEQWNWEQVGTMTVDEATQLATVMLLNYELSGCEGALNCDDVIACLLGTGILDDFTGKEYRVVDGVPQWSFDGETWTDFADEPTAPYAPPATPTPGNDDEERICLAATRAVNTINELHRQTWGVIQEGLADIATTFMIRMRDTLTTLVSLWYGEVGAVVFGELLRIGAANPANFIAQGMTEQEKQDFVCLLIEHATVTNGVVSFDFGAVRDNAVAALGLAIGPDIYLLLQYIQSEGLNAASRVNNASTANCNACIGCAEGCETVTTLFDNLQYKLQWSSYLSDTAQWEGSIHVSQPDTTFTIPTGPECITAVRIRSFGNVGQLSMTVGTQTVTKSVLNNGWNDITWNFDGAMTDTIYMSWTANNWLVPDWIQITHCV